MTLKRDALGRFLPGTLTPRPFRVGHEIHRPLNPTTHGRLSRYNKGCRCGECREAKQRYEAEKAPRQLFRCASCGIRYELGTSLGHLIPAELRLDPATWRFLRMFAAEFDEMGEEKGLLFLAAEFLDYIEPDIRLNRDLARSISRLDPDTFYRREPA